MDADGPHKISGFFSLVSDGAVIAADTKDYQIEGYEGNWMVTDFLFMDGKQFYLMEHQKFHDQANKVILDSYGKLVTETGKAGFDEIAKQKIRDYEKAEELSGLYENIGNPADAAEQNADLKTEMADRMHAFESEFQAYNPLMRKFLINEFNADLLMPDGDLESLLVQYQWIAMEYSVIKHSIFLRWLLDGQKEIAYETVRDYIVIICRMTGYDEEDIYEYLENSFEELVWDWGYLALVVG